MHAEVSAIKVSIETLRTGVWKPQFGRVVFVGRKGARDDDRHESHAKPQPNLFERQYCPNVCTMNPRLGTILSALSVLSAIRK